MPLSAIRLVAKGQNGVGAHILPCRKLDFFYCDWGGSSRGMIKFITHTLAGFAKQNPQVEITVSPRPNKHPVVLGHYLNGRHKAICVRNLEKEQILQKVELLRNANGAKLKRVKKPVISSQESVRGVWSGIHGHEIRVGTESKVLSKGL
ncbi:hypothetical protein FKW77_006318 [Venturia effusa]|uniref:Large ribosomal subunit protein mL43 n=1 Tax=Venturia effusa TaxID=50376 RepID=A0A517LP30_9PEZI|nr:hypothetical protein FKW77_006318 [Venturia effusa]